MPKAIGIDGCKAGWFFVSIDNQQRYDFGLATQFGELKPYLDAGAHMLVDIPIGLLTEGNGGRQCERQARKVLGPRASSVFPVPCRSAVYRDEYAAASAENQQRLGFKLSKQTWGIVPKIREVDMFMRTHRPACPPREMHPEICFWALNGRQPMQFNKKDGLGFSERMRLLSTFYEGAEDLVVKARLAHPGSKTLATDDIVDALVGAITASMPQHLATLPQQPILDDEGIAMEMVFAGPPAR